MAFGWQIGGLAGIGVGVRGGLSGVLDSDARQSRLTRTRLHRAFEGERLVCYDNERGKGDHRHIAGKEEEPYTFTTVEKLIEDFKADVRRARGGP